MTENNTTEPNEPEKGTGQPESPKKPVVPGRKWKTALVILIGLIAVAITVNTSIKYEAAHQGSNETQKPPPTYTGESPLSIASLQEAYNSNNEFVLVVTPCTDPALNTSITNITVQAANKIRSTYGIYVGVFVLPANAALTYPTVLVRLFSGNAAAFPVTMRADITTDSIFNAYLDRSYLR